MAFCGRECMRYGGDSSCYMVRAGEETLFLDAGSGLSAAPADYPKPPVILLSHLHLDHLIGLGVFPGLSDTHIRTRVYVPFCADRREAEACLSRVFAPKAMEPREPSTVREKSEAVTITPFQAQSLPCQN